MSHHIEEYRRITEASPECPEPSPQPNAIGHRAKTYLSRLLDRVAAGEEIVIAKNGKPVARLVPVRAEPRRPGRLKGRVRIGPDFDAPLPEPIAATFRGAPE